MAKKVFISYSHKDQLFRDELEKHLSTLKRNGLIDFWTDRDITPGQEWDREIKHELEEANLILFLISSDFLSSDYCYDIEVKRAMERNEAKEAIVVPIILRQCDWQNTPFSKLQALPADAKPIKNWSDSDNAYFDVVKGIKKLLEKQKSVEPKKYIELLIQSGDALELQADVIALKYARDFYGLDGAIANLLISNSVYGDYEIRVPETEHRLLLTKGTLKTPYVLFLGVCKLYEFGYKEIKAFSFEVIKALSKQNVKIKHLAMTIHGAGYGLDELEAFKSQLIGLRDAINAGVFPKTLERITIVEKDIQRVKRLNEYLNSNGDNLHYWKVNGNTWSLSLEKDQKEEKAEFAYKKEYLGESIKESVFVAMPFKKDFDDVYYFGIQGAAHENNLLCERIDQETFTGDILRQILKKIENAKIVIAEITGANPNVYLEIGYAWGHNKPTILLVKNTSDLQFDLQGQKCLTYERIIDLKSTLTNEIKKMC